MKPREPATRPLQRIHANMADVKDRDVLMIADQFNGWPHVVVSPDKNTNARRTIEAVGQFFTNVGAQTKLW